jgi:hypothetical protein
VPEELEEFLEVELPEDPLESEELELLFGIEKPLAPELPE